MDASKLSPNMDKDSLSVSDDKLAKRSSLQKDLADHEKKEETLAMFPPQYPAAKSAKCSPHCCEEK